MAIHYWSYFGYNRWINRFRNSWINIFDIQTSLEDIRSNFHQKKADGEKYNKLKKEIFSPLSLPYNIVREVEVENAPFLCYDKLKTRDSGYYTNAKKHFKKIKILKRFEDLEQRVKTYNGKLNTENEGITKIVSDYLKDFDIYIDGSIPSKENTVLINNLIPELKLFWSRKMFNYIQEQILDEKIGKKELRIKGALIIIVSDKDKENKIRECIECLKHNQTINEKYDNILVEMDNIMIEAEELSKNIKKQLVET